MSPVNGKPASSRSGEITERHGRKSTAAGKARTPGFIDPLRISIAKLLWDGCAKPALFHGVDDYCPPETLAVALPPLKQSTA